MGIMTRARKAINNKSAANNFFNEAIEATKLAAKNAHLAAQNDHKISAKEVENIYEICKKSNEFATYKANVVGGSATLQDCLKTCTDFNLNVDTYNHDNGFVGDMAFAYATCH